MKKINALLFVMVSLAACAGPQVKEPQHKIGCNTEPQWFVNDEKGIPARAVFLCFQDDGSLKWSARPLTAEEIKRLTTPVVVSSDHAGTRPLKALVEKLEKINVKKAPKP